MNHKKRGIALLFNHEYFMNSLSHLKPRSGTNVDCENLGASLKNLGFEVESYHNYSHKNISNRLEEGIYFGITYIFDNYEIIL